MSKLRFQAPGASEPIEVSLERADPAHDGAMIARIADAAISVDVEHRGSSDGWLKVGGKVHRYYAHTRDGGVEVWLDGVTYKLEVPNRSRRRGGSPASAAPIDQIVAPMPGTVLKVNVAVGDSFKPHQPLVILESMKMEMTLSAPNAGTVEAVHCKVGELVPLGTVLLALKAAPSTAEENDAS